MSTQPPQQPARRVTLTLNDRGEYIVPVDVPAGSAFHYWDGRPTHIRHADNADEDCFIGTVAPHVHLAAAASPPLPLEQVRLTDAEMDAAVSKVYANVNRELTEIEMGRAVADAATAKALRLAATVAQRETR